MLIQHFIVANKAARTLDMKMSVRRSGAIGCGLQVLLTAAGSLPYASVVVVISPLICRPRDPDTTGAGGAHSSPTPISGFGLSGRIFSSASFLVSPLEAPAVCVALRLSAVF